MINKTKAAMQGRQCHYQKLKQSQDTRVNAGGQSLSAPVITGTAPLGQFGFQIRMKWFTEFGHLNRGDMLTSEQHRCHNEKKKFQRRV
ncbi:hypothetical protein RHN95_03790 [Enterobacter kobei]|uniref:hypothetical protein n=1 Tax=Enterobacter kobei TaxID=208224 RepID=UPI003872C6DA